MKKIYLIVMLLIGISISCTDKFEEYNTDEKNPVEVPGDFVFANAQKALADQVASTNVNENIWKLIAQYWTETTYTDEANYDIVNRTIPDIVFRTYYRDILADFKNAKEVISGEPAAGDEAVNAKANKLLIIDMCNAYCYQRLVNIFGNVPYNDALDIDNILPSYDNGNDIYRDLISKTQAAVDGLNPDYGSFGANDLYFGGDVAMWIKFGNSLLVKMGITMADVDGAFAASVVEGAYQGAFAPTERCELVYLGGSNSNPLYVDLVQSGRHDFVAANTLVDKMNDLEDPRRTAYFAENLGSGVFDGGVYGESSPFANYTHIADPIQEADFPMTLLDGIEVQFYLAEAAARGYGVSGSAEGYYNSAITASFLYWGLNADQAAAYAAKPAVAYDAANWQQSIGEQAWIAFYLRGLVAWTSYRRLDAPALNIPPAGQTEDGDVPRRFTYPINEQTLNAANYQDAIQLLSPAEDKMITKVFWDKN